jgi:1-acyl-sn-glycerol-3-phosphate acyltransferase
VCDGQLETVKYHWGVPFIRLWVPLRVAMRLACALAWTFGAYFLSLFASMAGLFSQPLAKRWAMAVSRRWVRGMPAMLGMCMTVVGNRPEKPYFLVFNHISWLDVIAINALCDARTVIMAPMVRIPVMGRLWRALDAIPTRRIAEDTPACLSEMMATLRRGDNLLMAPEGNISPGMEVRRFRPRLLEAATRCNFPVHYVSLTYRTPKGCPPASDRVLFGPDPDFPYPGGKIPEAEFEGWGTQRSFLSHVLRLLALPYFEIVFRFGPEPVHATHPVQLANTLQQAVTNIFVPVQGQPAKADPEPLLVRAGSG